MAVFGNDGSADADFGSAVESSLAELWSGSRVEPSQLSVVGHPGLYAWWERAVDLTPFWPEGFPEEPRGPVYLGVAKRSFTQRFGRMHFRSEDPTRWSSLRRSLAALLCDELELLEGAKSHPRGKFSLSPESEARLTSWMDRHLQVSCVLLQDPAAVEEELIRRTLCPLNYEHATGSPYRAAMRAARAAMHRRIREANRSSGP